MITMKLATIVKILVKIEHVTNQGATFWPKGLDNYFSCYGVVMSLATNSFKFCNCTIVYEIAVQFLCDPMVFYMFYLYKYFQSQLVLSAQNSLFSKKSVITMATLHQLWSIFNKINITQDGLSAPNAYVSPILGLITWNDSGWPKVPSNQV